MVLEGRPVPVVLGSLMVPLLLELPAILEDRLVPAVPGDLLNPLLRWLPVLLEARADLAVPERHPARYSTVG